MEISIPTYEIYRTLDCPWECFWYHYIPSLALSIFRFDKNNLSDTNSTVARFIKKIPSKLIINLTCVMSLTFINCLCYCRASTGENWHKIMLDCFDDAKCDSDENRSCGSTVASIIYFCTFYFFCTFLVSVRGTQFMYVKPP